MKYIETLLPLSEGETSKKRDKISVKTIQGLYRCKAIIYWVKFNYSLYFF
jgi:hypothetical protein